MTQHDILITRTLSGAVTDRLREAIVRGDLTPGQPLWQEQLAEQFGVSRVPIREALRHLAAEGLVTLQSHRSAVVTSLSSAEVEELIVIGGALDIASVDRAVPRLTTKDLDQMKDILVRMRKLRDRPSEWLSLNLEFHLIIIRASEYARLESVVIESRRNLGRYVAPVFERAVRDWDNQHCAIYKACLAGDEQLTRQEIQAHWQYTGKVIASSIDEEIPQQAPDRLSGRIGAVRPIARTREEEA